MGRLLLAEEMMFRLEIRASFGDGDFRLAFPHQQFSSNNAAFSSRCTAGSETLSMSVARPVTRAICHTLYKPTSSSLLSQRRCIAQIRAWQYRGKLKDDTASLGQSRWTRDQVIYPRKRRRFSVSTPAQHGHLTPPKPGEECVACLQFEPCFKIH